MSYLDPPPLPAPVVVMKDVGGYVSDYKARTELYRTQNREVRLHECRSACTLALSLPNVCVYPTSTLKFHQAYNPFTKETDLGISEELWRSYPAPVRARLGALTRQYKVIRGDELIALGVRDCNAPGDKIMIAKAKPVPAPPLSAPATPDAKPGVVLATLENALSNLTGGLFSSGPAPQPGAPRMAAPLPSGSMSTEVEVPLPPPRPPMIGQAEAPPPPAFLTTMPGAQPILPARFVSIAMAR